MRHATTLRLVPAMMLAAALGAVVPATAQEPPPAPSPAPHAPPPAPAVPPAATAAAPAATAHVTYVTAASVYFDAGRDDGLQVGDSVEVVRNGAVIAQLTVTYLSAHRADCAVTSSKETVAVGDTVRYTPRAGAVIAPGAPGTEGAASAAPGAAGAAAPAAAGTTRQARGRGPVVHGRVGAHYLMVKDSDNSDLGFSQPGLDLRVDATGMGPVDAFADVRARRTYRKLPAGDETDNFNGVYRLAVAYHPGDPRQSIIVGRQFAPSLAVISLFDGLLYEYNGGRWSAGGLYGAQPNPDLTVSTDITQYGGYWQYRGVGGDTRTYEITTGAISSYDQGNVNRQFAFLQGRYRGPRLSGFAVTEIDYNSGWKVTDAGQGTIDPTSIFAAVNYRAGESVTLNAGYDNRRNVLLYRDRITPATEFDDSHRQGGWGGISFRMGRHAGAGADLRRSTGGPNGTADGYSVRLDFDRLTSAALDFSIRGTHYANDLSDGTMYTFGAGFNAGARTHLELLAGHLDETSNVESPLDRTSDWFDLDLDVLIARRWYLLVSGERYRGDGENNDQLYTAVTFRF